MKLFSTHKVLVLAVLLLIIPFYSCKKVLDENSYSSVLGKDFFSNMDEANAATLGVYEIMATTNMYGANTFYFDDASDIEQIVTSGPEYSLMGRYLHTSSTGLIATVWDQYYRGIERANIVIDRIPKMVLFTSGTPQQISDLKKFIAEAKFLRGFYYAELVKYWGDIPMRLTPARNDEDLNLVRTDRYEVYQQVFKDMQEAAADLPATLPNNERVNKWAVKSVMAKVALQAGGYSLRDAGGRTGIMKRPDNYREFYTLAKQQIDEVIAWGGYRLNPDYTQVFKNQCQHIYEFTENIFEVAFYNSSAGGSNIGFFDAPATVEGVYYRTNPLFNTTPLFRNSFADGDLRKDFNVANYSIDATGQRIPILPASDNTFTIGKWSREYQKKDPIERNSTNINNVILRYSDLLLMRAEVENELNGGPNQLAYDAINEVRRRAFGLNSSGLGNGIAQIQLTKAGAGYPSTVANAASVKIDISGGGGNGATAKVTAITVVSNVPTITGITITNPGSGYTSVPTVTISTPWADTDRDWQADTQYAAGTRVFYNNNFYNVATAGKSTATPPTHTSGNSTAASTGAVFTYLTNRTSPNAIATATAIVMPKPANVNLSGLNQSDFFEAIKKERAWELCFEGGRKADLIRWNILGPSLVKTQADLTAYRSTYTQFTAGTNFRPNVNELYPIPLKELDVNKKITQNPGY